MLNRLDLLNKLIVDNNYYLISNLVITSDFITIPT